MCHPAMNVSRGPRWVCVPKWLQNENPQYSRTRAQECQKYGFFTKVPQYRVLGPLGTETHRDTQRHTETHRDTQRHTETHRDTQTHTHTRTKHNNTQQHATTPHNTQHRATTHDTHTQHHHHASSVIMKIMTTHLPHLMSALRGHLNRTSKR